VIVAVRALREADGQPVDGPELRLDGVFDQMLTL
jgi:hypothetical protein